MPVPVSARFRPHRKFQPRGAARGRRAAPVPGNRVPEAAGRGEGRWRACGAAAGQPRHVAERGAAAAAVSTGGPAGPAHRDAPPGTVPPRPPRPAPPGPGGGNGRAGAVVAPAGRAGGGREGVVLFVPFSIPLLSLPFSSISYPFLSHPFLVLFLLPSLFPRLFPLPFRPGGSSRSVPRAVPSPP